MRVSPNYIASLVTGSAAALCLFAVLYSGSKSSDIARTDSGAIQIANAASNVKDTGGRLADLADEFDMGTISNNEITEKSLPLTNTGTGALEIRDVQTSCGCTKAYFKDRRDQHIKTAKIPPGESVELFVSVDPFRVPGFTSHKICTLFTNDPERKAVQFQVAANVDPEFEIEPEQLHLGVLDKGEQASGEAILRQLTDAEFDVSAVRAGPRASENYTVALNARPESEWRTPGKKEWTLSVDLDSSDLHKGLFRDRLYIETNIERLKTYAYMINAEVQTFYSVIPELLHRRDAVDAGTADVAESVVTSDQAITIENVQVSDPALKVAVDQANASTAKLVLGVAQDATPGVKNGTLTFDVVAEDGTRAQQAIRAIVAVK